MSYVRWLLEAKGKIRVVTNSKALFIVVKYNGLSNLSQEAVVVHWSRLLSAALKKQ